MSSRLSFALAFLLFFAPIPGAGLIHAAPGALVRASVSKPAPHVGETVILELTILVPGWFSGPVTLPAAPEVAGAQVRLSETPGANLNETIAGVAYAGIRRHYAITPQKPGRLEIPPLQVDLAFSDGERQAKTTLHSPAQTLQASIPAGMADLGYFIAAPRYRLRQSLDRALGNLRVGDALVRTIVQSAEQMPAVQLPVLRQPALDGIASYADDPVFEDRRGEREAPDIAGQTQRITYLLQRPGEYTLPAVEIRWFNTRSGKVETARLPALPLHVAAAAVAPQSGLPEEMPGAFPETPARANAWAGAIHWSWFAGFVAVLAWLGLRTGRLRKDRFLQNRNILPLGTGMTRLPKEK